MNILLLDQFSELGGAQRCLLDLLPAVHADKMIAAVPGSGPLAGALQSFGAEMIPMPCGPYRSGTKSAADALRFAADIFVQTRILNKVLDHHRIDLIYANGPRVWPAAAAASRGRIPAVFHAHNHVGRNLAAAVARWSIRFCAANVIACCEFAAAPLRRSPNEKFTIVPNGTRDCGYRERGFSPREWRIGLIGRIAPEKGQLEFVHAAARVSALHPNARFVICGAPMFGGAQYLDRVRSAAAGLPIEFAGWREDIGQVLAGLDLLVIASHQEAMPRVLLEAFSAGVPVISFDVGGISEVIDDNETGFLVRRHSAEALASRITDALVDPYPLRRIAARARTAWEQHYTLEHYRRGIMRVISQATAHSSIESGTALLHPNR